MCRGKSPIRVLLCVDREMPTALDPMLESTPPPPPSLCDGSVQSPRLSYTSDQDNYIERLEHLQLRLGAGTYTTSPSFPSSPSFLSVIVHPSWVRQAPRVLSYCAGALAFGP